MAAIHLLADQIKAADIAQSVESIEDRYLLVKMASGKLVVVYLVYSPLSAKAIKRAMRDNTTRSVHSLFVVSMRLLPVNGTITQLPAYLNILQTLYHSKVYAYVESKRGLTLFPVRFRTDDGNMERRTIYQSPLTIADMTCGFVETSYPIQGFWATANFQAKVQWEPSGTFDFQQYQTHYQRQERRSSTDHAAAVNKVVSRHHYEVLGVAYDADEEQIRQAYRQLARQFHPDLNTAPDAKERMQEINVAYQTLMRQFDQ